MDSRLLVAGLVLVACCNKAPAEPPDGAPITVKDGVIYKGDQEWLKYHWTNAGLHTHFYKVTTPDKQELVTLTVRRTGSSMVMEGRFPSLERCYVTSLPRFALADLLAEYRTHGVISNTQVHKGKLEDYVESKGSSLKKNCDEPRATAPRGGGERVQEVPEVDVSVQLRNNCSDTVRLYIGTNPGYGSGTTTTLGGNNITNMRLPIGKKICIVDGSTNPISCSTISAGMSRIEVNSSGTGFMF